MKPGYCRSCIMKDELSHLQEFEKLGIEKAGYNRDGVLKVNVPTPKIDKFVKLYLEIMGKGRWNEYAGEKTGFYFKMASGETRHFKLEPKNIDKINRTLQEFIPSWSLATDLVAMLRNVDIYRDWFD